MFPPKSEMLFCTRSEIAEHKIYGIIHLWYLHLDPLLIRSLTSSFPTTSMLPWTNHRCFWVLLYSKKCPMTDYFTCWFIVKCMFTQSTSALISRLTHGRLRHDRLYTYSRPQSKSGKRVGIAISSMPLWNLHSCLNIATCRAPHTSF